jgi:hypothetical protein
MLYGFRHAFQHARKFSADTQISAHKERVGFGAFLLKAFDNYKMSAVPG